MTTWHDYLQHPDAHPERPWWRYISSMELGRRYFIRPATSNCLEPYEPADADLRLAVYAAPGATVAALAAYDAAHPLPAPPPRCGQVWLVADKPAAMVVSEEPPYFALMAVGPFGGSYRTMGAGIIEGTSISYPWPPPGAVLVAGPGSPWAPMGCADE